MPRRRAFTLVELLVVIGVIVVLIAILLPSVSKARVLSNRVKCASNQRQLATAVVMYSNNFGGVLPFCNCYLMEIIRQIKGYRHDGWLYAANAGQSLPGHVEEGGLWKYMRSLEVYRCPVDEPPHDGLSLLSSYRMNHTVAENFGYHPKMARFRGDAFLFWELGGPPHTPTTFGQLGGDAHPSNGITARHGKFAPVACFDGHVETLSAIQFAEEAARDPGRLRCPPAVTWD
jgi:prepilin-type N-terminal cleavage/methylation domain-containing protein